MKQTQIANYLKAHPEHRHRRYIPLIVEALTGVAPKDQIDVKVAIRRLQEQIPNDVRGRKMERDWRDERGMKSINEFAEEAINEAWTMPKMEKITLFPVDQLNIRQ